MPAVADSRALNPGLCTSRRTMASTSVLPRIPIKLKSALTESSPPAALSSFHRPAQHQLSVSALNFAKLPFRHEQFQIFLTLKKSFQAIIQQLLRKKMETSWHFSRFMIVVEKKMLVSHVAWQYKYEKGGVEFKRSHESIPPALPRKP